MPAAPDVPIQIAHLAGAGGYDDPLVDQALSVFVDAIEKGDPRAKRLYFDVTSVALPNATADQASLLARSIRQLGPERILYGSDAAAGGNLTPREGWAAFRKLPLTDAEFAVSRAMSRLTCAELFPPRLHAFSLVSNGSIPSLSTNQATVATGSVARLAQNLKVCWLVR